MILITVATELEARPLINKLKLKSVNNRFFRIYSSVDFTLVITGIGKIMSASATSYILGKLPNISGALNFGAAGSLDEKLSAGTLAVANTFVSASDGKTVFTDILFEHDLPECKVKTADSVITNGQCEEKTVVEEEAYGFVTAARCFLECDKVASLKLVSDDATKNDPINFERIGLLINENIEEINAFINDFSEHCSKKSFEYPSQLSEVSAQIVEKYSLTVAQKNILNTALQNTFVTYGSVPDIAKLPEAAGHGKKNTVDAFNLLLEKSARNEDCIPIASANKAPEFKQKNFMHTYIENDIKNETAVKVILSHLNNTEIVYVPHYKSVFNRSKQNMHLQSSSKNLILAKATGTFLYEGSDYCNSFGFDKFFYCSTVIGCVYNCEYCYLQGMYPTSNITVFVNIEDFFNAINQVDDGSPMLVCCSYDSDIVALDGILHTVVKWLDFARLKPNITFEIRTKCASIVPFEHPVPPNVIVAYTLSPEKTCSQFEHGAPSLKARLSAAEKLSDMGIRVRLCIEPCLYPVVSKNDYISLADAVLQSARTHTFEDIVIGGFRMNKTYFNTIRSKRKDSKLFCNPFAETDGESVSYYKSNEVVSEIAEALRSSTNTKIITFI